MMIRDRKRVFLATCFFLLGVACMLLAEKTLISARFSLNRFALFALIWAFVSLHLCVNVKKLWMLIFNKRFIIGIGMFILIVINGFHGSSVNKYADVIEPGVDIGDTSPFLGEARSIRSDEFIVDTPTILSQLTHNSNFSTINDAIMGRDDTTVLLFPQLPTWHVSVLSNPKILGFLVLPQNQAFSFFWYLPIFIAFFATFEVSLLVTKGKKLYSLLGAVLLTLSPVFLWWNQLGLIAYGFLAIWILNLFLKETNIWKKLGYSLLFGLSGSWFIMLVYPAWLLPFGYLYLGLFIWSLYENRKGLKWLHLLYLIPAVLVIVSLVLPAFLGSQETIRLMSSTVYPAQKIIKGGTGSSYLMGYLIAAFFTIKEISNPCEFSQFLSLFPIPVFLAVKQIFSNFKQKKTDVFLVIFLVVAVFLTAYTFVHIPIIEKITFLSVSDPKRAQLAIGTVCILLLIRWMSNYEKNNEIKFKEGFIVFAVSIVVFVIGINLVSVEFPGYVSTKIVIGSAVIFIPCMILLMLNRKGKNAILVSILLIVSGYNAATIQPVSKGLSIMTEKPLAKEVQKISKENPEAKWMAVNTEGTFIYLPSYLLSNGARVVNSTNFYPNFDLWEKFDELGNYDEVYNRYAHILIDISNTDTTFELLNPDLFRVTINVNDLHKSGVKYFATSTNLDEYSKDGIEFKQIYGKDNIKIYEAIYEEGK